MFISLRICYTFWNVTLFDSVWTAENPFHTIPPVHPISKGAFFFRIRKKHVSRFFENETFLIIVASKLGKTWLVWYLLYALP